MNMNSYFVIYVCPNCGRTYKHEYPSPFNPELECGCDPKVMHKMEEVFSSRYRKQMEEVMRGSGMACKINCTKMKKFKENVKGVIG